jgi:hypothetical protein
MFKSYNILALLCALLSASACRIAQDIPGYPASWLAKEASNCQASSDGKEEVASAASVRPNYHGSFAAAAGGW